MRLCTVALSALAVVFAPLALSAQAPRPTLAPGNTVLLAAYNCHGDQLARADTLMKDVAGAVLDKHVAAGRIISWGYMGVYIGSQANRHIYVWAKDPVSLVQAREAYLPEIQANARFAEFVKICGSATVTLHNLISSSAAK